MASLKVITCNVRGIRDKLKRKELFVYLNNRKADVIFLQETHCVKKDEKFWVSEFGGTILFNNGNSKSRGVAIMFKKELDVKILKVERDEEGRSLIVKVGWDEKTFVFANAYAPNHDDPNYFLKLFEKITEIDSDYTIMGGDLNIWLDPKLDKKGGKTEKLSGAAEMVNGFLDEYEWVDVWRHMNPGTFQYTWKRRKPFVGSRLDYFLVPLATLADIIRVDIIPGCNSDHLFVEMLLEFENTSRGRGYWKLNTSLLSDKTYIEMINKLIEEHESVENEEGNEDPGLDWDWLKHKIYSSSRKFAKDKASVRKAQMAALEKKIISQEKKLAMINLSAMNVVQTIQRINLKIEELRNELNKHLEYIARGAILRSKVNWYVYGEHCTSYFCSLEKSRSKNKQMRATKRHDGTITKNTTEILRLQSAFYENLYTSDPSIKFCQENKDNIRITPEQKITTESPITLDEIGQAIKQMPRHKSPGADGIPVDFYKVFWIKLKDRMLKLFNYCFKVNRMHTTARQGIISIIPKKGRDILLIRSWRPIVLLCVDFKVISKVISNRIREVLNTIIHTDQNGFVPGRNISNNIRKAYDVLDYTSRKNIAAVLISVDFEKAFDRVEYSSLYSSLEYFGFGNYLIKWMKIFFTDFQLSVTNAGYNSPWFTPTRGLFQGNPIGPNAFLILVEILAINLRRSKNIKTIRINDVVQLLSQFADDMDIYMQFDQKSWEEVMRILNNFEASSGMKINYDKTTVYRIGSIKNSNAKFYSAAKLKWTNDPINVLGIWISTEDRENMELNLDPLIYKVRRVLDMWYHRGLSLFGKIIVVNTLAASLLNYRLSVIRSLPIKYVQEIENVFRKFIWNTKSPKIKFSVLKGHKMDGGAGLVNILKRDESLKLDWVFRYLQQTDIANRADEALGNCACTMLWSCSLNTRDAVKIFSTNHFWGDVLTVWTKYSYQLPTQKREVLEEILWLNSNIRVRNTPVYYRDFVQAGITKISDIYVMNRFLSLQELVQRYSLSVPFTVYGGLLKAIPKEWKKLLKDPKEGPLKTKLIHKCESYVKKVGIIYKVITRNEDLVLDYYIKWVGRLDDPDFSHEEWIASFHRISKLSNCVKLRSFQYKLLLGTLITNVQLVHYKIKDTNLCTFCDNKIETLIHLFWDCPKIRPIWDWFVINFDCELNFINVLFSRLRSMNRLVDKLSLIAKYYIYKTRCTTFVIRIEEFIQYCEQIQNMEKYVAKSKDKHALHDQIWSNIENM